MKKNIDLLNEKITSELLDSLCNNTHPLCGVLDDIITVKNSIWTWERLLLNDFKCEWDRLVEFYDDGLPSVGDFIHIIFGNLNDWDDDYFYEMEDNGYDESEISDMLENTITEIDNNYEKYFNKSIF